jgi:hypothetical protein
MRNSTLRELAIALLNDDMGVSEKAWTILRAALEDAEMEDIIKAVDASDNRYYLPNDFTA